MIVGVGYVIMKKRILSLLLVAIMTCSLCACGGSESTSGDNKEDGFTPSQITEEEETEEKGTVTPEEIDVNNLQKYYDVEKFIGTPRLEKVHFCGQYGDGTIQAMVNGVASDGVFRVQNTHNFKNGTWLWCIICDNNTPDDVLDDTLAYIFTTPIEE